MAKHIVPGWKSPDLPAQKLNEGKHTEKLKAVGYGLLAVITSLAILALCIVASFFGAGFLLAKLYGPGDLAKGLVWLSHTLYTSLIFGSLFSIYPICKVAQPLLAKAKQYWNAS